MKLITSGDLHASFEFGAWTMTALRDGYVDMPTRRLRQPGDRSFGGDLPPQVELVDGALRLSVNTFAFDDGDAVTLIDAGASDAWDPSMGRLPEALGEAGIDPGRIRTVAFTHTHIDHINGLVLPGGGDACPKLRRLLVPANEMGMFCAEARLARFHEMAEPFEPGQRLADGIEAIDAAGHEVGHTCFRVSSGGDTVLVWGDVVHVPSIQFERPEIAWELDTDQDRARETRRRILDLAADNGHHVAGAHLHFPGIGRVKRSQDGYRFEPI